MIGSVVLFVGMSINYRLLEREKEEEERERDYPKEECAAMLAPPSPSKAKEDDPSAAITMDEVARMDEDTV